MKPRLQVIVRGTELKCNSKEVYSLPGKEGGLLGSGFAGYVPLASQNPHPIIVYSVANYRPHLSHFWENVIVISKTEFNACLPEFFYPKNPENVRPHSSSSTENVTPL